MGRFQVPRRPPRAGLVVAVTVALATLVLAVLPAPAARRGALPPLLPEPQVAALAAELSGTNARQIAQEITLYHRMRGSRGLRAAAEAVARRARDYGLAEVEILELPADGEIVYGTQRSRPAWDADFAELWELEERDGEWVRARRIASYETRPVTLAQDSASGRATAELVDVGEGTAAADYAGKDVRGKLVLAAAQPGQVAPLAVAEGGAAGIISYAQNQKSAWWGEDRNLVRWGHLATFPPPETFAFMVSVNQALEWRSRLARGEAVRLSAQVEAGQHPGVYAIPTAVIPGSDPDLAAQEIVFSCHLDHLRPGANDNASGCAAILEVGRALAKLVREGRLPPPRRTLRFVWPPEIEGTLALLNARPDLAARARAVVHMDMVGGDPEITKAIFHITSSPASLPTFVNDVARAFGRFVNQESYAYAATGEAAYPLVDPEGSRQALQARFAPFSMGSDHEVWTEGSFLVPAIYLNDWPDRTIHTHADRVGNLDPTKLLRAAFLGAASGYTLARLVPEGAPEVLAAVEQGALERLAADLGRSRQLPPPEAVNLLAHRLAYEQGVVASIDGFAPLPEGHRRRARGFLERLAPLATPAMGGGTAAGGERPAAELRCRRAGEPKGLLWGFGYSAFEDRLARAALPRPGLLAYQGPWGGGGEMAYEVLNLAAPSRSAAEIRDAVAAAYGPVPDALVVEYLRTLEKLGFLDCDLDPRQLDWTAAPTAPLARRLPAFPVPEDPLTLGLAGYAKVLCSAVFVSGRDEEEARENSAFFLLPAGEREQVEPVVDRGAREVRVTGRGGLRRTARFYGDQGCIILPEGSDGIFFDPVAVASALPPADTLPWPMGDAVAEEPLPPGVDAQALSEAVDAAFADPEAHTAAFLVVHGGRILAERYAPGIGPETQLEGWSMGKSVTATLVGRLVQQGAFQVEDPAPVPAWRREGDPRGAIRILDLLHMSGGLAFIAFQDPDYFPPEMGYAEHAYIYTGGVDVFELATTRPLQFPPNTVGRYRNSDPLVLGYLVKEAVSRRGGEYLTFPQRELFDKVGIRRQVLETDPYGNFIMTGYDYGTARGWARLGMLYLSDGVWQGERLLPQGWSELVSTPAPAWPAPVYGGLFWLNRTGNLALPSDAYFMAGAGGQYTIIVPSLDLVVVRLGHMRGLPRAYPTLNAALEKLTAALGAGD